MAFGRGLGTWHHLVDEEGGGEEPDVGGRGEEELEGEEGPGQGREAGQADTGGAHPEVRLLQQCH